VQKGLFVGLLLEFPWVSTDFASFCAQIPPRERISNSCRSIRKIGIIIFCCSQVGNNKRTSVTTQSRSDCLWNANGWVSHCYLSTPTGGGQVAAGDPSLLLLLVHPALRSVTTQSRSDCRWNANGWVSCHALPICPPRSIDTVHFADSWGTLFGQKPHSEPSFLPGPFNPAEMDAFGPSPGDPGRPAGKATMTKCTLRMPGEPFLAKSGRNPNWNDDFCPGHSTLAS
jgi:hypothetical protein